MDFPAVFSLKRLYTSVVCKNLTTCLIKNTTPLSSFNEFAFHRQLLSCSRNSGKILSPRNHFNEDRLRVQLYDLEDMDIKTAFRTPLRLYISTCNSV
jgi:hypothetical protein